jgi:single-strand DNA-binding protein
MANFNKVILMGNLTRDPELRYLPSGQALARIGLAVNRKYRNRNTQEMVEETTFVDVEGWGQQAETFCRYMTKGRPVFIEGRLKLDSWQDKEGQKRSKLTVVMENFQFLGSGGGGGGGGGRDVDGSRPAPARSRGGASVPAGQAGQGGPAGQVSDGDPPAEDYDFDDIPF